MSNNFYQFYSNDIISGFICELLRTTNIPLIDKVDDISEKPEGLYIYQGYIAARIKDSDGKLTTKLITPYNVGEVYPNITFNYTATNTIYNSTTHYMLGKYLRYLRDFKGINLMHLYNCFSNDFITDVEIDANGKLVSGVDTSDRYISTLVPVKLGATYTIAINCDEPYNLHPLIYGPKGIVNTFTETFSNEFHNGSNYNRPFTYTVSTTDSSNISGVYSNQRYLKLLIQLPAHNKSSITVLEGDYTSPGYPLSKIRFLQRDDNVQHAFNLKLVEYLLGNVIAPGDVLGDNIRRIQEELEWGKDNYTPGVWEDNLTYLLYVNSLYVKGFKDMYDVNGYADKDSRTSLRDSSSWPREST